MPALCKKTNHLRILGGRSALRKEGYDVLAISELHSGADDEFVVEFTLKEDRILISEDKDFGQLIYAKGRAKITVLFIRYPAKLRKQLPQ